jgi:glycerophosphoryl diester phosphodiesterase
MLIIGHRGAKGEQPENTLTSFDYLRQAGFTATELDLHLSQDNKLIVIHDDNLQRTCLKSGLIRALPQNQICNQDLYNAAAFWPNHPKKEAIPSLNDLLNKYPEWQEIQLEVKPLPVHDHSIMHAALDDIFKTYPIQESGVVTSSDRNFLLYLKEKKWNGKLGWVCQPSDLLQSPYLIQQAQSLGCSHLIAHHSLINEELLKQNIHANIRISVWTVNQEEIAKKIQSFDVDSIITDYPANLVNYLSN